MKTEQKKSIFKIVATATATLGLLLSGLFSSPKDIINIESQTEKLVPIVEVVELEDEEEKVEDTKKETLKERIKNLIYRIPVGIRFVFLLPLWIFGTLLSNLIGSLVSLPLKWLLSALILILLIGFGLKLLFPNKSLKEIFSLKMILTVLTGCLFFHQAETYLIDHWENYHEYKQLIELTAKLSLILLVVFIFHMKTTKQNKKNIAVS